VTQIRAAQYGLIALAFCLVLVSAFLFFARSRLIETFYPSFSDAEKSGDGTPVDSGMAAQ
jgi:hypothetical protein